MWCSGSGAMAESACQRADAGAHAHAHQPRVVGRPPFRGVVVSPVERHLAVVAAVRGEPARAGERRHGGQYAAAATVEDAVLGRDAVGEEDDRVRE